MQADGAAALARIEQGRYIPGIFAARIQQGAAAGAHGSDLDFLPAGHGLTKGWVSPCQSKNNRNSQG